MISFPADLSQGAPPPPFSPVNPPAGSAPCGAEAYQQVHHVGLVVPQRLHRVEHVHGALVPQHLAHDADGAEGPAAAAPVPVRTEAR